MRAVLLAAVVVLLELLVIWGREAVLRYRERRPTWEVASHTDHDRTLVLLRLVDRAGTVVDEHVVAAVPSDAYDRHRHLLQAQLEAEGRAMRLNGAR
jgi:hypothetical protein